MLDPAPRPRTSATRLLLVSFLSLFYEMVVIRWFSAQCPIFAYYANLPLITAVFGIGLGCILAPRRVNLWPAFGPLLLLFVYLATTPFFQEVSTKVSWTGEELRELGTLSGWKEPAEGHAAFLFLLLLSGAAFVPIGQEIGRAFQGSPPLAAYSLNLVGSLVGVWGFALLCWVQRTSLAWFAVAGAVALLLGRWWHRVLCAVCLVPVLLIVHEWDKGLIWSPYYHIELSPYELVDKSGVKRKAGTNLAVNTNYYQKMIDFGYPSEQEFPDLQVFRDYYEEPYRKRHPKKVLIVGAGTGNDVAAALRCGATWIDAVEIDPEIYRIGCEMHPERPYDNPFVHAHVEDARSFFKKSRDRYDLVVFAILDSHTLVSGIGRLRLDNYVYTLEALQEARDHLMPDGVVHLAFTLHRGWVFNRFYGMFKEVFGEDFVTLPSGAAYAVVFAGGKGVRDWVTGDPKGWRHDELPEEAIPDLPTDDWPFIYKEDRTFPKEYAVMLALLLGCFVVLGWGGLAKGAKWDGFMASLGAAFLLLEVRGMASLALLFGATWVVTAVVITMVLVMALLGNLLASIRARPPSRWMHALLWGTLILNYAVPSSAFLGMGFVGRSVLGGALVALPLFFAGFLFASAFREAKDVEGALGSNLLGAVAGGLSEYLSMVSGIRALLLLALFYYLAAFMVWERRAKQ